MSPTAMALLAACALASACERGRLAINPQRDAAVSAEVSPPSADAVRHIANLRYISSRSPPAG